MTIALSMIVAVVMTPVVAVIAAAIVAKCEDLRDPHTIPLYLLSQELHFLGRLNRKVYLIGCEADAVSHTTNSHPSQQDLLRLPWVPVHERQGERRAVLHAADDPRGRRLDGAVPVAEAILAGRGPPRMCPPVARWLGHNADGGLHSTDGSRGHRR